MLSPALRMPLMTRPISMKDRCGQLHPPNTMLSLQKDVQDRLIVLPTMSAFNISGHTMVNLKEHEAVGINQSVSQAGAHTTCRMIDSYNFSVITLRARGLAVTTVNFHKLMLEL